MNDVMSDVVVKIDESWNEEMSTVVERTKE